MGQAAREAAYQLATVSTAQKNQALAPSPMNWKHAVPRSWRPTKDIAAGRGRGSRKPCWIACCSTRRAPCRHGGCAQGGSPGRSGRGRNRQPVLENGLRLSRRRVPIGVIGVIYEARPNVTIDIASLCLKTGNASILRGGRETLPPNLELVRVIQHALAASGLPGRRCSTSTTRTGRWWPSCCASTATWT